MADKAALIEALVAAGLKRIQVTSFVHPRLVPQMADAEELCASLTPYPGVTYSGLALNLKGIERAHSADLTHIDMSVSASDAHSHRNANRSVAEALQEYDQMYAEARSYGMTVRGGIQCAFGYRQPDDVSADDVLQIARHFIEELGVDELALADSSNVLAALQAGVRHFDTAFGGLGGCPFIAGATGNIATEDTVFMLHEMGLETGIDLQRVARISRRFAGILQKDPLPGKLYQLLTPEA